MQKTRARTSRRATSGVRARVEHIMGTAISIAVCAAQADELGAADADELLDEAFALLRRADAVFSPFLQDSQISRLRDGRLSLDDCDGDVREVLRLCEWLRRSTGGYFDANAAGPEQLDPCGVVKGWAAERASAVLADGGLVAHYVNAGGDVRLRRPPRGERRWRIGIVDPHRLDHLLVTLRGSDVAVATSGLAERGPHVVDPHRRVPAMEWASVTVVGPSLTLADGYATAAVAMGRRAVRWLDDLEGYEALLVDAAGGVRWTSAFHRYAADLPDGADRES